MHNGECNTAASQAGEDSLEDEMDLNSKLHQKLAELQRLKELKAAAVKQQSQSAQSQGTPQNGSPCSTGQRPAPADSPEAPQGSKTGNPYARDAGPPSQAAQHSTEPVTHRLSSTWGNLFSSGKRRFNNIS